MPRLLSKWETANDLLNQLSIGDLIEIKSHDLFSHWAVYIGKGKVIHLTTDKGKGSIWNVSSSSGSDSGCNADSQVKEDDFVSYAGKRECRINNSNDDVETPFSKVEIVERARSMVGMSSYNVMWRNCEHFVNWCRYGNWCSRQARKLGAFVIGIASAAAYIAVKIR